MSAATVFAWHEQHAELQSLSLDSLAQSCTADSKGLDKAFTKSDPMGWFVPMLFISSGQSARMA